MEGQWNTLHKKKRGKEEEWVDGSLERGKCIKYNIMYTMYNITIRMNIPLYTTTKSKK